VNRCWQEVFGTGLVKTAEDFGIMGDSPSHPELLDWLAVEFRESWDLKKLYRLMVTSRPTARRPRRRRRRSRRIRQPAPLARAAVPDGRRDAAATTRWRRPRRCRRRSAGPSVKPYQPDGVWDAVGMRESNTKTYKRDTGEALYRRSLYWFWKRMAPPASMEILNAPSREVSCLRRERTNTPLRRS
jgi:hypothetical protein